MAFPTEHHRRKYEVFLRGPVGVVTFAFGSVEALRSGYWHAPVISQFPTITDNAVDDFGIQSGGGFAIELVDEPGTEDWYVEDETYEPIQAEDNSGFLSVEY